MICGRRAVRQVYDEFSRVLFYSFDISHGDNDFVQNFQSSFTFFQIVLPNAKFQFQVAKTLLMHLQEVTVTFMFYLHVWGLIVFLKWKALGAIQVKFSPQIYHVIFRCTTFDHWESDRK